MRGYLNPGEKGGSGVFTSPDGKKSVRAFYEYSDRAAYIGNKDRVALPASFDERVIRRLDCRDKNNKKVEPPRWLYGESTLKEDRGDTYGVTFVAGDNVWLLRRVGASEGDGR